MRKLIDEAKELIKLKSVSEEGNEALTQYLAELMKERGLKVQLQQVFHSQEAWSKRQFNVIGIMGDTLVDRKTKKGLLLCTHLDTGHPGASEHWTETLGDPFHATVRDGKLYGLGSADSKLDFLAKLVGALRLRERKFKSPLYLVGTCGAELGGLGARYLTQSVALNPKVVMVGQPTSGGLVHQQDGELQLKLQVGFQSMDRDARGYNRKVDLQVLGRIAPLADTQQGENAITRMGQFLNLANENGFEVRYTKLEGWGGESQIPDRAWTSFYLTSHQLEDFKRFFRGVTRSLGGEKHFKLLLSGLGESGARFLPDPIFSLFSHVIQNFGDRVASLRPSVNGLDFVVSLPIPDGKRIAEVETETKEWLARVGLQFPQFNLSMQRVRQIPGYRQDPETDWVRRTQGVANECGYPVGLNRLTQAGEAAIFAEAGYDVLTFGPGEQGRSSNEGIQIEAFERAIEFYEKLIERTCL